VIIAVSLPLTWWRFRHDDREALVGIACAMVVLVLFVPAALPWYYTWPLAVMSALAQSRKWVAGIATFSTWIMVIFKPDGSHGMYSWPHVLIATACAALAWSLLCRAHDWAQRRLVIEGRPARAQPRHPCAQVVPTGYQPRDDRRPSRDPPRRGRNQ
jgi:alpha-1,6-mannosyltransferase